MRVRDVNAFWYERGAALMMRDGESSEQKLGAMEVANRYVKVDVEAAPQWGRRAARCFYAVSVTSGKQRHSSMGCLVLRIDAY
jgi:hypothetical protein